jgi:CheY-like chemotaxis protein
MSARILVVDDDPQILKLYSKILTKGGYAVTIEPSGKQAIKILEDEPFDLLVLDLCMPQPDGFEVLEKIRTRHPGLRTLVTSGFMDGALLLASEALGATASLNKKDSPDQLLQKVNLLLRN